jgi:hypothetical protein
MVTYGLLLAATSNYVTATIDSQILARAPRRMHLIGPVFQNVTTERQSPSQRPQAFSQYSIGYIWSSTQNGMAR